MMRKDPRKFAKAEDLLNKQKELKDARRAFDVRDDDAELED